MVQNQKTKRYKKQKINGGGTVTVLVVTYKKPKILKKCLTSLVKNAGIPFNLWLWDNSRKNIGLNAYAEMAEDLETEYVVTVDEDVIHFPKDWLKDQLDAFTDIFKTNFNGKAYEWPYWGWLGLNVVRDKKTNGALWPEFFKQTKLVQGKRWKFRVGHRIPQTCAMMQRDTLKALGGFPYDRLNTFYSFDGEVSHAVDKLRMAQGILEEVKIYHASGPYYNREHEEIWKEKHNGQTIKEAEALYRKRDKSLNFGDNALLEFPKDDSWSN